MSQKTDIILIIFSIVISVAIVLTYVVYRLEETVYKEIELYKEEYTKKIKQNINNYVDIAFSVVDFNHKQHPIDEKDLRKQNKHRLRNIIDVAENVLTFKLKQVNSGKLTEIEAQTQAANAIKQIRYDGDTGYIWITDTTRPVPKMIMHPKEPQLNGKILDDSRFDHAIGKNPNVFVEVVELLQNNDDGFVQTETNPDDLLHELSYVRLFSKWNWVIGTGINHDGYVKTKNINLTKNLMRNLTYDNGTGYFWLTNNDESSPKVLVYPLDPLRENKKLVGKYTKHGALVQSFIDAVNQSNGKGSNYYDYKWDKPTDQGTIKDLHKISYVKLYEPLGMIIGTGVYLDEAEKIVAKGKKYALLWVKGFIIKILIGAAIIVSFVGLLNYLLNYFYFQYLRQSLNSLSLNKSSKMPLFKRNPKKR